MQNFFNDSAYKMCEWSYDESDRIKASRIYEVALKMERKYRKFHRIPTDCNRLVGSHIVKFPKSEKLLAIKSYMKDNKLLQVKNEESNNE